MLLATVIFLDGERLTHWVGRDARPRRARASPRGPCSRSSLAVALLVALGAALFKLLPNVKQRWSHVIIASIVTTLLWIVATLLFRFYVQHFGVVQQDVRHHRRRDRRCSRGCTTRCSSLLVGGELASELHHGTGAIEPTKGAMYSGASCRTRGRGRRR